MIPQHHNGCGEKKQLQNVSLARIFCNFTQDGHKQCRRPAGSRYGGAVVQELSLHAAEEPLKDMIQLSQVSLSELNEYRQSNDSTIAAWAAKRRTDEDLADLHQCVAEAEASLNDYERFIELDVRFHSLLARASANQVAIIVTEVLGNVEKETLRSKMLTLTPEGRIALGRRILDTHSIILEAIRQQDSRAARSAMQTHTKAAGRDLQL